MTPEQIQDAQRQIILRFLRDHSSPSVCWDLEDRGYHILALRCVAGTKADGHTTIISWEGLLGIDKFMFEWVAPPPCGLLMPSLEGLMKGEYLLQSGDRFMVLTNHGQTFLREYIHHVVQEFQSALDSLGIPSSKS